MSQQSDTTEEDLQYEFFEGLARDIIRETKEFNRRERNKRKGLHILARRKWVENYKYVKPSMRFTPDFFGDSPDFELVRLVANKHSRVKWVICTLFNYWMYDVKLDGFPHKPTFTKIRDLYGELLLKHRDGIKSRAFAAKQERVRKRREAKRIRAEIEKTQKKTK